MDDGTYTLVVVDVETTGLSVAHSRIVSVAASCAGAEFSALVNPKCPIPRVAARVHGITDARVRDQPDWATVGARFWAWVRERASAAAMPTRPLALVGHNAKRFDVPLLVRETLRAGGAVPRRLFVVDTLRVCRFVFKMLRCHRQAVVYETLFGRPPEGAHNALWDVRALSQIIAHPSVARHIARFAEAAGDHAAGGCTACGRVVSPYFTHRCAAVRAV